MKTTISKIAIAIISFTAFTINAQTMEESLKSANQQLDTSKTINAMMSVSSTFDIITSKWPNELMTNYYSAYSKATISYTETDVKKKDLLLDQADKFFVKVKQINPENDETYVLAALLANARLSVDGQNRWKQYGEIFDKNLEKAKAINPNNPRIYYLKGSSLFYTPKMFGGGAKKAKVYFEKAKVLFEKQDKTSILKPIWGEWANTDFLKKCNN
jgi:hypothetical protein